MDTRIPYAAAIKNPTPQQVYILLAVNYGKRLSELNGLLGVHGLSEPQYNILRILKGAGPRGLSCQGIADRLLTRLPDITRLLDRLEKAGWIERRRSIEDRRKMEVSLLAEGRDLVARLDQPVLQLHIRQFNNLDSQELTELHRLLSKSLTNSAR
jgi:DNA-binding MarR family transcriptional regulator